MKTCAIIAEYNPFHNGHKYQLEKISEQGTTHTVVIMSGNYTQRGDFAIAPKHYRAEAALRNGADLVLEIPTPWAMAGAETFARAGVEIANALGVVDELAFGSECGDIEKLEKIASTSTSSEVDSLISTYLSEGITFAAARSRAIGELLGEDASKILSNPNDILGVEYIKALQETKSNITPVAIRRYVAQHDIPSDSEFYKSASEIREKLINGESVNSAMPVTASEVFRQADVAGEFPISSDNFSKQMLYCLRKMTPEDFLKLPDIGNEGLHNKLYMAVSNSKTLEEVLLRAKSKRYPMARIRRIVMSAFLGLEKQNKNPVPYIKVLGLSEKGAEILRAAKDEVKLPVIMRYADTSRLTDFGKEIYELESRLTDIYSTGFENLPPCGMEKTRNPVVLL